MDDNPPIPAGSGKPKRTRKAIPVCGWKIRFDSPPQRFLVEQAEAGDILALFRAWHDAEPEAESVERRTNPRYAPATTRAWVGWWKRGSFHVANAEIVNLSQGGALMNVEAHPPSSQPVWVCLGTPYPVDFVQARVLGSEGKGEDPISARLEFHTPCPPSFFLAAGLRSDGAKDRGR
jgi:hypothetical protein